MIVILLGPPGAGKGTIAALLQKRFGWEHVSTGDLLREEMRSGSDLGEQVRRYVESGDLVPDDLIIEILKKKLGDGLKNKPGFILDGFPRTTRQAEQLDAMLAAANKRVDYVIYMDSTLPVILRRLTGRLVCPTCGAVYHKTNRPPQNDNLCDKDGTPLVQRSDDNEETIRRRMDVYIKNTQPILDYYKQQGKLVRVNADQEAEEVMEDLEKVLNEPASSKD